jgi:hypothetical protein
MIDFGQRLVIQPAFDRSRIEVPAGPPGHECPGYASNEKPAKAGY